MEWSLCAGAKMEINSFFLAMSENSCDNICRAVQRELPGWMAACQSEIFHSHLTVLEGSCAHMVSRSATHVAWIQDLLVVAHAARSEIFSLGVVVCSAVSEIFPSLLRHLTVFLRSSLCHCDAAPSERRSSTTTLSHHVTCVA